ncbi:HlyD family secretion protein [Corallococcus sp. bb12-1]|uniref:HlyD family secretion protein n=1 Tax=Corallococcus sp. bb12-1 TaxID=2996784 RepID=UPI0022710EAE|nr:HlyD family secretion protein [Corallococcus sp. bb12-1]MCY1041129.1 HlyD family secretion protein [Corallococcus sp. bb12-1]
MKDSSAPATAVEAPSVVPAAPAPAPARPGPRGSPTVLLVMIGLVLASAAALGIRTLLQAGTERTEDATLTSDIVALSARASGEVARVFVQENQQVRKGEVLVELDERLANLEVARAEARLALVQAQQQAATSAPGGGRPELAAAQFEEARQAVEKARLQRSFLKVVAPRDGMVARLAAREGQFIGEGQRLLQLVPPPRVVIANFKETQIRHLRPGQRVTILVDAYAEQPLQGKVVSLAGGTNASFALLPPNNASGNFVKVVQRVPVRIALDAPPLVAMPTGLSVEVIVDTN